jgi:hypothetical protein
LENAFNNAFLRPLTLSGDRLHVVQLIPIRHDGATNLKLDPRQLLRHGGPIRSFCARSCSQITMLAAELLSPAANT